MTVKTRFNHNTLNEWRKMLNAAPFDKLVQHRAAIGKHAEAVKGDGTGRYPYVVPLVEAAEDIYQRRYGGGKLSVGVDKLH